MALQLSVLLVDDDPTELLLAQEAFEAHAQTVNLVTCSSGPEALAHLQDPAHPLPDVIVTDLNMPGMTGLDVIRLLKNDPRLHLIPVVVLSNSNDPRDVEQAYSLHANSYLVKAPDFSAFMEQIDTFLAFWREVRKPYQVMG
ncbi:response regulator [Deinococcus fonticola]|uniref:response regulator n=1 Tax=Deinococcus fonticola TaxID=2528713 RepID=UPI001074FA50|nr:response regulator [Deinococcus fonticola]